MPAASKCPKCDGTRFEAAEIHVEGASKDTRPHAVQCAKCGAVLAVLDHVSTAKYLARIERKVNDLARAVADLK